MPSPIGHGLAGVAVAWSTSRGWPPEERALTPVCALLAASADFDLVLPQTHRAYTHSIGAVLLIMIVAAAVTRRVTPRRTLRITLVCGAAYASHLLLDWISADTFFPYGIRALWPFDDRWYISGWDLFEQTARRHLFSAATMWQNARAIAREVVVLAPVVAAIAMARTALRLRREERAATTSGDRLSPETPDGGGQYE